MTMARCAPYADDHDQETAAVMKAARYYRYGSPEVVQYEDVPIPVVRQNDLLIRVRAASVNPLDYHFMRGTPYLVRVLAGARRPKRHGLGADLSGSVEQVGDNVTGFAPGDDVFGSIDPIGTLAEYISVPQDAAIVAKPASLTFEQAAAVPVAAFTALQALRDKGSVRPGQRVLVNGAAGGVGTFAVQIAKALGATVTGVCSTANVEMVTSIGADQVVDYCKQDFTTLGQRYDVMVDMIGNHTLAACRSVLAPGAVLVGVGGSDKGRWIGPLSRSLRMAALAPLTKQKMVSFLAHANRDDLVTIGELIEAGKVNSVIDRTYPLADAPEAIRYLEQGHARGKVVVII